MIPSPDPTLYLLKPLLAALLLFGSAHVLGRFLSSWMGLELVGLAERLAVRGALGLGSLGAAGLVLGWAGAFHPPAILVLLAIPLLLASFRTGGQAAAPGTGLVPTGRWLRRALLLLVVLYALANLVRALYPPTGFDALNYHLPAVERYLERHALTFPTDLRFAAGPALVPVLFVFAGGLGGDLAVQLTSFGMGLLTAAAVHAMAARGFGSGAAALATALFYTTPIVGWLSAEAYVDLGLALFLAAALHCVLVRLDGGGVAWTWTAGLLAGAALGTRYLALAPVLLLAVDLLSAPVDARVPGRSERLRAFSLFVAGALLMALPWYVRNVAESGDPIYPFAGGVVGEPSWTAEERSDHAEYLRQIGPGRGPLDLLLVPFRLTFQPGAFGASRTTGIGYAYLFLLPLLFLVRGRGRTTRLLTAYVLVGGLVWFYTSQQTRFLLPWLLALAVLGGLALDRVLRGRVHLHRGVSSVLGSLGLVVLLAGGTRWPTALPPLGGAAREAYLRRHLPDYDRVERINMLLPPDAVLYAFGEEGRRYYYRCRSLGDWFGPTAYGRFLPEGDPEELMGRFRRLGVTHLLIPDDFADPALRGFRQQPYWWDHLMLVDVSVGVRLYRLLPEPGSAGERDLATLGSLDTGSGPPEWPPDLRLEARGR